MVESIKKVIHWLTHKLGISLRRYTMFSSFDLQRQNLIKNNNIDTVIDGGANIGQYANGIRKAGFKGHIVSIEPSSGAFRFLEATSRNDPVWRCFNNAIGDENHVVALNISQDSVSSSILNTSPALLEYAPCARTISREDVEMVRLDDIIQQLDFDPGPIMLKLDIQGMELRALAAASGLMAKSRLIELEASLVDFYDESPSFDEVKSYLERHGFRMVATQPNSIDEISARTLEMNLIFERFDQ